MDYDLTVREVAEEGVPLELTAIDPSLGVPIAMNLTGFTNPRLILRSLRTGVQVSISGGSKLIISDAPNGIVTWYPTSAEISAEDAEYRAYLLLENSSDSGRDYSFPSNRDFLLRVLPA